MNREEFSVFWRNHGHWDIVEQNGRLFTIRGEKGNVIVTNEQLQPQTQMKFLTVSMAMAYVMEQLMYEN